MVVGHRPVFVSCVPLLVCLGSWLLIDLPVLAMLWRADFQVVDVILVLIFFVMMVGGG